MFVAAPNASKEDDGIVLSVVLNARKGRRFC
ncbi:MAG: carotenoid oxygenase family protein [Deltaproteobacteria bacterium]|nr:carotenoid oxygenase family protein [Deltaproteobacteria bacterium]